MTSIACGAAATVGLEALGATTWGILTSIGFVWREAPAKRMTIGFKLAAAQCGTASLFDSSYALSVGPFVERGPRVVDARHVNAYLCAERFDSDPQGTPEPGQFVIYPGRNRREVFPRHQPVPLQSTKREGKRVGPARNRKRIAMPHLAR